MEGVIPVGLRVHLAHATVQAIARECGIDVLHVKGPALDEQLRPTRPSTGPDAAPGDVEPAPRMSTDADILVRPSQVKRFLTTLGQRGWGVRTTFSTGSAFEHAASLWHTELGYVDLHRQFPGIGLPREEAFEVLWASRHVVRIAHQPCFVPSIDLQRLLLLLHGARGGGLAHADVQLLWSQATERERQRSAHLARELQAEVALAAATGRLDDYKHDPTHDLWHHFSSGDPDDRMAEWKARFKAQPTAFGRLRIVARSVLVNTDHLAMEWGRRPTRTEIVRKYMLRGTLFGREVWRAMARRVRRGQDGERP